MMSTCSVRVLQVCDQVRRACVRTCVCECHCVCARACVRLCACVCEGIWRENKDNKVN